LEYLLATSNDLRIAPKNLINTWLRSKQLEYSGNVYRRLDEHLASGSLQSADLGKFLDEYKDNGRKHVYLFTLSDVEWATFNSAIVLKERFDTYSSEATSHLIGRMIIEKNIVTEHEYVLRLVDKIEVPKIDTTVKITHEGREWAAVVYTDVYIHIVFCFNTENKTLTLKFDSVKEMGQEHDRIYRSCVDFLGRAFGIESLSTVGLSRLASLLEGSTTSNVFNLIGKVETEDEDGNTVTGTVHITRDDSQLGSASALPGGREVLSPENEDVFLDTYDVLWLCTSSDGHLTRNVRTTIKSLSGNINFRHHVFKEEMDYVLSCIRDAISGRQV
jgi:hypothetical protein